MEAVQEVLFDKRALTGTTGPAALAVLREACQDCNLCSLRKSRRRVVFGSGADFRPLVAVVRDQPTSTSDETGKHFAGKEGELLGKILEACHLDRQQVFLCSVVNCRAPAGRRPKAAEVTACRPWFERQLWAVQPRVVVAMGPLPAAALLGDVEGKLRGVWHSWREIPVRVTLPLTHALREGRARVRMWSDWQAVMGRLGLA